MLLKPKKDNLSMHKPGAVVFDPKIHLGEND